MKPPEGKEILLLKDEVILVNGSNEKVKLEASQGNRSCGTGKETVQKAETRMIPTGRETGQERDLLPRNPQGTSGILQETKQEPNS